MLSLGKSLLRLSAVRVSFASSCSVTSDGSKLRLVCDDEPERRYHSQWLRHNCRCPICLPSSVQQNIIHHRNLIGVKITHATMEGDDRVLVNWESKTGPHSGSFDVNWLKDHDYSTRPGLQERRIKNETPLVAKSLLKLDYEDVMGSLEGYYEWMKLINHYGLVLLQNVPIKEHAMFLLTDKISPPQVHPYSLVYDVLNVPDPEESALADYAYSSNELLMHNDESFMESQPGVQLLSCLRFDKCVEGGDSIFVDTVPVLEEFRNKHPKQFEALTRIPCITHRYFDDTRDIFEGLSNMGAFEFKYSQPHISVDHYGQVCSIGWSPQFRYPLAATEKETEEYYEAFVLLSEMFEEAPMKVVHRLQPGETFTYNNRRMLHTRKSFELNGGVRHLQGYYINVDFFLSGLRIISKRLNKTDPIKRMFNRSHVA